MFPQDVYMEPAGKERNAWTACALTFAEKVDDRRELVGTIADAALTHCQREQTDYVDAWMRAEGWDTMKASAIGETQVNQERQSLRSLLIERRLSARVAR